jgi:cytochrome c biogenesis protein CcmG/thiol:disulfide interchange protein DsbE
MSNRGFIAVLAAVAFVALLGYGLVAKDEASLKIGAPVPDAPVDRLGEDGQVSLSDYRGQWVLVNLWASWCDPCRDEAPALESYGRRHRGDVVVLGIDSEDASPDALAFAREYGITYELLHDGEGERKDALGATGLPETYLVDPDGNLALHRIGPVDERYLESSVTPLVTGRGTGT